MRPKRQRQARRFEIEQLFKAQRKRIAQFDTRAMGRIREARWGGDGDDSQLLISRK